jgi:hypothetical protein
MPAQRMSTLEELKGDPKRNKVNSDRKQSHLAEFCVITAFDQNEPGKADIVHANKSFVWHQGFDCCVSIACHQMPTTICIIG